MKPAPSILSAFALALLFAAASWGWGIPTSATEPESPSAKGKAADFFPLRVGNSWRFEGSASGKTLGISWKIIAQEDGRFKVREVSEFKGEKSETECFWWKTDRALFQEFSEEERFERLRFPPRVGDRWPWQEVTFEVLSQSDIDVSAGRFRDCFRVKYPFLPLAAGDYLCLSFAPDAGVVLVEGYSEGKLAVSLELVEYDVSGTKEPKAPHPSADSK